jgi:type IV pilus assembly protein PilX
MKQQHGSVLIISLLILLVMTIIGISAMSSSTMEEKMAASDRNQKAVFQNAESSLKAAESALLNSGYDTIRTALLEGEKGYYSQDDARFDYLDPSAWDSDGADANCIAIPNNSNNAGNSCYVIEESGITLTPGEAGEYGATSNPERGSQITKVTVRSSDSNGSSAVTLQSNLHKTITY